MKGTCFIYVTRYGTTLEIISDMAMVAGPSIVCRPDEFDDSYKECEWFVLATPVYTEEVDRSMTEFIEKNIEWLRTKKLVLLCVTLIGSEGKRYLEGWRALLGDAVVWAKSTGGRLKLAALSPEDYENMRVFEESMDYPLMDADFFDKEQVLRYAMEIRDMQSNTEKNHLTAALKGYIEKYLCSRNTCALATAAVGRIRTTPLEYYYEAGCMYILSEGGEKFAHIMLNPDVSLCIYDEYDTMDDICGIQIQGRALIIEPGSSAYAGVLAMKKLDAEAVDALPFKLYALKIELQTADFIWHGFTKLGWEVQQHYTFDNAAVLG